jgi:hypothetical protein
MCSQPSGERYLNSSGSRACPLLVKVWTALSMYTVFQSAMAAVMLHSNRGKCFVASRYCTQIAEFRVYLYSNRRQSGLEAMRHPPSLSGRYTSGGLARQLPLSPLLH